MVLHPDSHCRPAEARRQEPSERHLHPHTSGDAGELGPPILEHRYSPGIRKDERLLMKQFSGNTLPIGSGLMNFLDTTPSVAWARTGHNSTPGPGSWNCRYRREDAPSRPPAASG